MGGGEGKKLHIQFSRGLSFFCNIFLSDTFGLPSSCYHLPLHHWIDFRESSSDLLSRCCGPGAASCLEGRPPAHILHAGMTAGQRQGENMNRFGPVVQGLREKYPLFLCVSCASLRESSQNLRFQSACKSWGRSQQGHLTCSQAISPAEDQVRPNAQGCYICWAFCTQSML